MKLTCPLTHGDETITELNLPRPTTKQVRKIGRLPYKIQSDESVTPDMTVVCAYVAELSQLPPSVIDGLDPVDINQLAWEVCGFFMTAPTASSAASKS
ncbi:phage tail assembly protein [Azoarcus indigens]|uniref:Tail assembly chaperone E/41/14-like protein n=1 Tax=Azoarcus indigens TaxID=29545 RepID=A0A4R6DYJ1_9RHOO|nr:phage tail assembly protein [Azoarcus indigens]NMG64882.1 phage tail assembly protein [Azoarcus indigens]TDN50420.1 tail assembly chaperone E/41/14-like protein [Azoarcus indigens]